MSAAVPMPCSTLSAMDGAFSPNDKSRRKIEMYVDSATPLECIPNVYDEVRYNNGTY